MRGEHANRERKKKINRNTVFPIDRSYVEAANKNFYKMKKN